MRGKVESQKESLEEKFCETQENSLDKEENHSSCENEEEVIYFPLLDLFQAEDPAEAEKVSSQPQNSQIEVQIYDTEQNYGQEGNSDSSRMQPLISDHRQGRHQSFLPLYSYSEFNVVDSAQNFKGNYSNYVSGVLRSLVALRYINFSSMVEEKKIILEKSQNEKKTLILDLDETLIHSDLEGKLSQHDHVISFFYEGSEVHIPLNLRPGLFEFLHNIAEDFEVFIFTASKKEYADVILDYLDPENTIFKHRFYRENCMNVDNKIFVKDLRVLANRKLENIVLVDNSLYAFSNQLSNGILINSFYDDKDDRELHNLYSYLQQYIHNAADVRAVNENIFNFESIMEELSAD